MKESISIENLYVSYDNKLVLEDINLKIYEGDLIAFIGPNGAGKSTLIKTILNFVKPLKGKVLINEKKINYNKLKIAYIAQKNTIDWNFPTTVEDVVSMGTYGRLGLFHRINNIEKSKVKKALEMLEIYDLKDRQISMLSGGQQQRVFLARALVQEASIYLLDEPFQGIDIKTEKKIIEILKLLKEKGNTIIVVHHDLSTVSKYFDKVVMINKKIICKGRIEDVFKEENISLTYKHVF